MTAAVDASRTGERKQIDWETARVGFEERGLSFRELADLVGASPEGVRKRALADGWVRDDATVAARDAERSRQTNAATASVKLRWAQRRSEEADRAGETAEIARAAVVEAIEDRNPQLIRSTVGAYMVFIDKAQLLSGGVTSRHDDVPLDERIDKVLSGRDELASRRRAS